MGERYLITGAQLGSLQAINNELERKRIIDEIIDTQFIGWSSNSVDKDADILYNNWSFEKERC